MSHYTNCPYCGNKNDVSEYPDCECDYEETCEACGLEYTVTVYFDPVFEANVPDACVNCVHYLWFYDRCGYDFDQDFLAPDGCKRRGEVE